MLRQVVVGSKACFCSTILAVAATAYSGFKEYQKT
jgi:hypothetical protein